MSDTVLIRLLPDEPNQPVPIYIRPPSGQSPALIDTANVAVMLHLPDNYPDNIQYVNDGTTPYIERLDLTDDGNMIFHGNAQSGDPDNWDDANMVYKPGKQYDHLWAFEKRNMNVTNDVDADGLLGYIYIDTTGFGLTGVDTFLLVLDNPDPVDPTTFSNYIPTQGDIQVDAEFGQAFIIIPEPVTLGLLAAGGFGLLLRRRRR